MSFNADEILAVWNKGKVEEGYDPKMYRKDACGAWMVWDKYGSNDNIYGWEIDHVIPQSILRDKKFSQEDIDKIDNLRPLQHQNNVSKGDDYPAYTAVVTAEGNKNVEKERNLIVNKKTRETLSGLYGI